MSTPPKPALRRGSSPVYTSAFPHLAGNGITRSCGRCGLRGSLIGSRKHPVWGMVCGGVEPCKRAA
jgi:hypothetical protein